MVDILVLRDHATLTKLPGSVSGQPFNITNCSNSTFTVLDYCDQVQIDDITKSKIFIGASSESIFIRDCKDCTFTIACKQLRTRDCKNCTIYLYCKTEPIIESSEGMKFGPFNGAYPGHEQTMKDANLPPSHNVWHAVYDFSDELKTGRNWSYVEDEEEDQLWCPLGEAKNCCPRVETIPIDMEETNDIFMEEENQTSSMILQVAEETDHARKEIKLDQVSKFKTLKSWMDFMMTYIHFPTGIQNILFDSLDHTARLFTSMKDSITSFLFQRSD